MKLLCALAVVLLPGSSLAQPLPSDEVAADPEPPGREPPPVSTEPPVATPLIVATVPTNARVNAVAPVHEIKPLVWHADFRFGAALDHGALAFIGAAGVDRGDWSFGLAVEWNPWFSFDTSRARSGAINAYGTLTRRWYDGPVLAVYSRAEAGTSTILFELVGVDKWETGIYLAGSLLGAAIKKSDRLRMTIDPSHFSMPIPHVGSLPFYYRQYRITVGLEYRFQ